MSIKNWENQGKNIRAPKPPLGSGVMGGGFYLTEAP
jgi:hypothetical protein